MKPINLNHIQLNKSISKASEWLYSTWLDNTTGTGWAHYEGLKNVTVWGGTLDGIRGLIRICDEISIPHITKSINWLKSVQQPDGGWTSWEVQQSCVDSTSWVIITLKLCNENVHRDDILEGIEFIVNAMNETKEYCNWGSFKGTEPRVYSTLLAIWALDGIEERICKKGAKWLQSVNNLDGGWGYLPIDGDSNIIITAMTLYVLLVTNNIVKNETKRNAIEWIKSNRIKNGLWENLTEDRISYINSQTKEQFPARTKHISTVWAILALLKAKIPVSDSQISESLSVLIDTQLPNGSWVFSNDDLKKYTWCTSNILWALVEARDTLLGLKKIEVSE